MTLTLWDIGRKCLGGLLRPPEVKVVLLEVEEEDTPDEDSECVKQHAFPATTVWRQLVLGTFDPNVLPEHLRQQAQLEADNLVAQFNLIMKILDAKYRKLHFLESRKMFATRVSGKMFAHQMFLMLDGRTDKLNESVWKMIKPRGEKI